MKSMSGFGQAEVENSQGVISVEIKSVNRRFFELKTRLPAHFLSLEPKIKSYLKQRVKRGALNLFVNWKPETEEVVNVDLRLAKEYYSKLTALSKKLSLKNNNLDMNLITQLPGVIRVGNKGKGNADKKWSLLQPALKEALDGLMYMREKEGEAIRKDILNRLKIVDKEIHPIESRSPKVVENYRKRLKGRIKELSGSNFGKEKLALEVALFADRSDISEELIRFYSLIGQFGEVVKDNGKTAGKSLEFILQEMNREINTIGAKAADSLISKRVIKIKSELEKIREETQNIE